MGRADTILRVMSPEDRKKCICYFCGSDISVKYWVRHNEKDVPCCNRCALREIGSR